MLTTTHQHFTIPSSSLTSSSLISSSLTSSSLTSSSNNNSSLSDYTTNCPLLKRIRTIALEHGYYNNSSYFLIPSFNYTNDMITNWEQYHCDGILNTQFNSTSKEGIKFFDNMWNVNFVPSHKFKLWICCLESHYCLNLEKLKSPFTIEHNLHFAPMMRMIIHSFSLMLNATERIKTWKKLVDHIQHTQNVIIVERGKTKQQSNNSSISSNKEEEHSIQHDANLSQLTSHLHQSSVSIVRGEEQLVVVTTSPSTLTLSNAELTISSTHSLSQPANEMETSKPTTFTTTSTPTITTNKISSQKESSSPYQALLLGYIRILCDLRLLSTLCFHLSVLCLMINSLIFFAVTSDFGNAVHQNVAPAIASLTFICSGLIPLSGTFLEVLLTISQQNATISIHAM
nr:unnamed protein product [Naegleria fowleri]